MATSRQMRAEQTRARLLDAGIGLIEERGYDNVSIKDIVAAADVSIGTFYHYFESKDVFYYAHVSRRFNEVDDNLAEKMDLSPLGNLDGYVDGWLAQIAGLSPTYLAHWLSHASDPAYHALVGQGPDVSARHIQAIRSCIDAYIERGDLGPGVRSDVIAETVVTLLYGIDVRYCMTGGKLELGRWGSNIKSFIYKNVAPFMVEPPAVPEGYDPDIYLDTGVNGPY